MPLTPQTTPVTTIRLDPVEVITAFAADMNRHAERAAAAARDGRARDAVLAAGAMQTLFASRAGMLRDALAAARSKRVPPEVRAAVRKAASSALLPIEQTVRAIDAQAKARRTRQAAIGEALRAASSAPARAYTAGGARSGATLGDRTVRHALAVTV